jgi:hypothetical protein
MNFIDKFFLWLVLLPASLYRRMGVNLDQLQAVLSAKLTMDNRRPAAFGNRRQGKEKKVATKATLSTMLGSLVMGLVMLYTFGIGADMQTKLTLFLSMFLFLLCVTLITDFTSVLIDARDNLIILPKPISDVTFVTARMLHITVRTSIIVLPMTLPALILSTVQQGPALILPFLLIVVLMTLFGIFLINAVYLLILKITTPARFQKVIGSIQIGFVMLIMILYQIMPRMMQSQDALHFSVTHYPWLRLLPTYWFADACMLLSGSGLNSVSLVSLVLSIVVPLLSIWLVVRVFAPSFNSKLGMITSGASEQSAAIKTVKSNTKTSLVQRLAGWFTKSGAENAGFVFASRMMARSRDFKMKVYPSIGYIIVMSAVFLFQDHDLAKMPQGSTKLAPILLIIIYMSSMLVSGALMQLTYSDKFKAAWMFQVTPVARPGLLISGAIKSVLTFFFLPLGIAIVILGVVLQGPSVLPNLLLACCNVLVIGSLIAYIQVRNLPFSQPVEGATGGGTFIRSMLLLILPGLLGVFQWFISGFQWVVLLLLLITAVVPWLVFDEIKKRHWHQLKS